MLASLVQNTRASASWRRFLRTSFSASRVSATVLRKRSSSACCSGLRICADLPAGPPCVFCRSCSLAVVFCSSSSSDWILPKYCFCASASSSRTTVSGRNAVARLRSEISSSPAANRSEEHTSELQSPCNLVCRLLLEKKKKEKAKKRPVALAPMVDATNYSSSHQ